MRPAIPLLALNRSPGPLPPVVSWHPHTHLQHSRVRLPLLDKEACTEEYLTHSLVEVDCQHLQGRKLDSNHGSSPKGHARFKALKLGIFTARQDVQIVQLTQPPRSWQCCKGPQPAQQGIYHIAILSLVAWLRCTTMPC